MIEIGTTWYAWGDHWIVIARSSDGLMIRVERKRPMYARGRKQPYRRWDRVQAWDRHATQTTVAA